MVDRKGVERVENKDFRWLMLGINDYIAYKGIEDVAVIYNFGYNLGLFELGYSHCSNKDCVCNCRKKLSKLLKNDTIKDYIDFVEGMYGVRYNDLEDKFKQKGSFRND